MGLTRCQICGRRMLPWQAPWFWFYRYTPWLGRMDCGGDCWRCVSEHEGKYRDQIV